MPTTSPIYLSTDGKSKVDIEKLKSGGTNAVLMTLAVPPGPRTSEGDAQGRLAMNEQLAFIKNKVKKFGAVIFLRVMQEVERMKKS